MRFTAKKNIFFFDLNPENQIRFFRAKSKVIFCAVNRKMKPQKLKLNQNQLFPCKINFRFLHFFSEMKMIFLLIFHGFKKAVSSQIKPLFWGVFGFAKKKPEMNFRFRKFFHAFENNLFFAKSQLRYGIA